MTAYSWGGAGAGIQTTLFPIKHESVYSSTPISDQVCDHAKSTTMTEHRQKQEHRANTTAFMKGAPQRLTW